MDLGLKDKVAVVTGGSVGIGLAIAEGLAQEGVHLVLCARNEERLTARASEIHEKYGGRAVFRPMYRGRQILLTLCSRQSRHSAARISSSTTRAPAAKKRS